jgi:putative oxidoreductase
MSTVTRPSSFNQSTRGAILSDQPRIDRAAAWHDIVWLFGRILIGGIFVQSGFQKLLGLDTFAAGLARNGIPDAFAQVLAPVGATIEFVGGLAIVLGLMTRYAAVLMILFVIVATLISHRFWPLAGAERRTQAVQFAKNAAIIGGFLYVLATGAGRVSLDRWWRRIE